MGATAVSARGTLDVEGRGDGALAGEALLGQGQQRVLVAGVGAVDSDGQVGAVAGVGARSRVRVRVLRVLQGVRVLMVLQGELARRGIDGVPETRGGRTAGLCRWC